MVTSETKLWEILRSKEKDKPQEPVKPLWAVLQENQEKKKVADLEKMKEKNYSLPREIDEDGKLIYCMNRE